MYNSPRTREDNFWGQSFRWKQTCLITLITGCMSQKISLSHWYQNFDVNRNILSLRSFVTSLKTYFWNLILYTLFNDLYMYIAPGQGQTTGRPHHFGHLLQVSKNYLQPLILYTSFHDLINVYSRGSSGSDNPRGTKFWCQHKPLVTSVICYKSQNYLFEVWFYTLYKYSPGAGADNPLGTKYFDVNRNKKSFWNLTLYTFLMILYMHIAPWQGQTTLGDKSLM